MSQFISFVGLVSMVLIAWALSEKKKQLNFRMVISGLVLQFVLALFILRTRVGQVFFIYAKKAVDNVLKLSDQGAAFVFGEGFKEHFFAFSVLSTIIFVSALMAVLFHLGIMQLIVKGMARLMVWVMDVSGSEALASASNVFVGQTEAPLIIRPYLSTMTRSELMALMTGGMATIAGGVMAAYVGFGMSAGHLLTASIMSAPAALVIAKIMVPEQEESPTKGRVKIEVPRKDANVLDAACRGTSEGLKLALNVGAMLIAFISLIALGNSILALVTHGINETGQILGFMQEGQSIPPLTLEAILGWLLAPLAWLMGVEWADAGAVGMLLGKKTILNEFIAYMDLAQMNPANPVEGVRAISERSYTIATYALCGFANFASIAILIGGISSLIPERRKEFAVLSMRALIGGTLASFMTACIAGILI